MDERDEEREPRWRFSLSNVTKRSIMYVMLKKLRRGSGWSRMASQRRVVGNGDGGITREGFDTVGDGGKVGGKGCVVGGGKVGMTGDDDVRLVGGRVGFAVGQVSAGAAVVGIDSLGATVIGIDSVGTTVVERDCVGTTAGATDSGTISETLENSGTTVDATSSVGRTEIRLGRTGVLEGTYTGIVCFSGIASNVELEEEAAVLLLLFTNEFMLRVRFGKESRERFSFLVYAISTIQGVTTSVPWNRESRPPTENTLAISSTKTRKRVSIALCGGIEQCDLQKKQTQHNE